MVFPGELFGQFLDFWSVPFFPNICRITWCFQVPCIGCTVEKHLERVAYTHTQLIFMPMLHSTCRAFNNEASDSLHVFMGPVGFVK